MTEELYKKSYIELLDLARQKGVAFPKDYVLPYSISKKVGDKERYYRYGFEDLPKTIEEINEVIGNSIKTGKKSFIFYSVMFGDNHFRNFLHKENAKKDIELLNKRHVIVAMSSSDPKYPVLL